MRFSICVPAYNVELYLRNCLDSILSQTINDYEVIIVDDGSKDSTGSIADEYSNKYDNIYTIHQKNTGLFHARISAMKKSVGDFIVHLDSDDWLEPDALNKISKAIDKSNADIVIFNNYAAKSNDNKKKQTSLGDAEKIWSENTDEIIDVFFNSGKIQAIWKKAIRRELVNLDEISKLPRITMTEDWIHSYYPMTNAKTIIYIPDALYNYRATENSMCKVFDPLIFDSTKIIYHFQMDYMRVHSHAEQKESPEKWLTVKIAKALIYNLAEIRHKEEYFRFLSKVYDDDEIRNAFNTTQNVQLQYKVPMILLYKKKFNTLYLLKKAIVFFRKNL